MNAQNEKNNKVNNCSRGTSSGKQAKDKNHKTSVCQGYVGSKLVMHCYTQGIIRNLNHISATYQRKYGGHKENAPLNSKMRGTPETATKYSKDWLIDNKIEGELK